MPTRKDRDGRDEDNVQLKMLTKDQLTSADGPEENGGKTVCAIIRRFALDETTAHGFPYIFRAKSHFERLLWTLIFTAAFVATIYQGTVLILKFRSFPVNTEVKIVSKARLPFPSVTVCNTNKLRRAAIEMSKYRQMLVIDKSNSLPYYAPCLEHDFACRGRPVCIKRYLMCDAIRQCGKDDPSDEEGCDYESRTCTAQQFRCVHSGSSRGLCIPLKDKCDRVKDCYDGEDEDNCTCKSSEFKCKSRGGCISKTAVCDGVEDCLDGSDEAPYICGSKDDADGTCNDATRFRCFSGNQCILRIFICDKREECYDGSDESSCDPSVPPTSEYETPVAPSCSSGYFYCLRAINDPCVPNGWVCDGEIDCLDGSDEAVEECGRPHCTLPKTACEIGGGCGIPCDLYSECLSGTDEKNCSTSLRSVTYQAQCGSDPNNEMGRYHCDGIIDCYNANNMLPEPCTTVRPECFLALNGHDYQGTAFNAGCLPWSHDLLVSRNYTGRRFPELEGAEPGSTMELNLCRNPGGDMQEPGCFLRGVNDSIWFLPCPTLSRSTTCHTTMFDVTLLTDDGSDEAASHGRVEVRYGTDTAGTISDTDWTLDDANVVCRQLGYPAGALTNVTEPSGPGSGRVLLRDVQCTGEERNLIDCFYQFAPDDDTDHHHDVSVACNTSLGVIRRQKRNAGDGAEDGTCPSCSSDQVDPTQLELPSDCQDGEFHCGSGEYVPCWQTCNKFPDCRDGSDEWMVDCPEESSECGQNRFHCIKETNTWQTGTEVGSMGCIPNAYVCDTKNDCDLGGSVSFRGKLLAWDELRCPEPNEFPPERYYKCRGENKFLHEYEICNTEQNCLLSDDDEKDCPRSDHAEIFKEPFRDPNWFVPYKTMLDVDHYFLFKNFTSDFRVPPFGRVKGEDPPDWDGFVTFSATPDYSDLIDVAKIPREEVRRLGHQKEDFILQCTYEQKKCNMSDFEEIQDDKYGNCYTFNDKNDEIFSSKTGATYGLQMTLFLEQFEYISIYGQEAGVRVAIEPPHIAPNPTDSGMTITPGTVTSVGLRYNRVVRKGPPYGDCQETVKNTKIIFNGEIRQSSPKEQYDRAFCLKTCVHYYIRTYCGCSDTMELNGPRCKLLNTTQEICRQLVYYLNQHNKLSCAADCPLQCTDVYYTKTSSMSKWPSKKFVKHLFRNIHSINNKTRQLTEENVFDNIARLEVFYEEFNYARTKEIAAYSESSLFGDIGGTVGLYIGFSLITACEFISLALKLIRRFCCATARPASV